MQIVAVDTGGTFSDLVYIDTVAAEKRLVKVHSVPRQPEMGFINAVDRAVQDLSSVDVCIHGTTVATNSILQRTGAKVGLITTRGFRDVIEIMRGNRPMSAAYDLQWEKPAPLVPRHLRVEVDERVDSQGNILQPLDERQVLRAAEFLVGQGCDAIAICFLESYRNPAHEELAATLVEEKYPNIPVSVSSRILPQWREYERFSTAVVDAFMKPTLSRYLDNLQRQLKSRGCRFNLMIMKSNGGVVTARGASRLPVATFESGPAAGVIAGRFYGRRAGFDDLIVVEMGGTSADLCLIRGAQYTYTTEAEVAPGIPIKIPMIDVRSIGAGGGSVAWIDAAGAVKVGPVSAGADPGPACYGIGGTRPTLTDAHLVLGRLNPANFLGGAQALYPELAHRSIADSLAKPLNMSAQSAAWGVVQVAVANMVMEVRAISAGRGWDPREFALVVAGGAGPLHAAPIARAVGITTMVVPPYPGLMSATGLLLTDLRFDLVRSVLGRLEEQGLDVLMAALGELCGKIRLEMAAEGLRSGERVDMSVDMRYAGQNYEINLHLEPANVTADGLARQFDEEHRRLYGFALEGTPHEIVNARATGIGAVDQGPIEGLLALHPNGKHPTGMLAPVGSRAVFDEVAGGFLDTPVFDRLHLPTGCEIEGPAVIEEMDSTTHIPSDARATVDAFGTLLIRFR